MGQNGPTPVFINKVLVRQTYTHWFTLSVATTTVGWLQQRLYGTQSLKYLFSGPLPPQKNNSLELI